MCILVKPSHDDNMPLAPMENSTASTPPRESINLKRKTVSCINVPLVRVLRWHDGHTHLPLAAAGSVPQFHRAGGRRERCKARRPLQAGGRGHGAGKPRLHQLHHHGGQADGGALPLPLPLLLLLGLRLPWMLP